MRRPAGPGRPKGGGLTPEQNSERLVDAAEKTFLRLGFDRTTIDDIAAEADVSRSTFYRHFSSRDQVLLAVISRMTDRYLDLLAEQLKAHQTLRSFTVDALVGVVSLVRADPALVEMFNDSGRAAVGRLVGTSDEVKRRARSFVRGILERARPELMPELRPDIDLDEAADHLLLVGLALIQGFGTVSDDEHVMRHYLTTFVMPPLFAPS